MRKGLIKEKLIQWRLRLRLQDRLPHPEADLRGAGLLLHQLYLLMLFRSSWRDLTDSERFKTTKLKG